MKLNGGAMEFEDIMPDQCPPANSSYDDLTEVYRVLEGEAPTDWDWLSHGARGQKPKPMLVSECRWISLSLTRNPKALIKMPNLRHCTHAAKLSIPASSGAHLSTKGHIDFWKSKGFNIATCISSVDPIDG